MRPLLLIAIFACMLVGTLGADPPQTVFYIQLIRGSNDSTPPTPEAKRIGSKLTERLNPIFKWTNYWEIKRETLEIAPGKSARKRMNSEREVEIDLRKPQEITLRIYRNGKPTREMRQSTETRFVIAGGDKDDDQSWFIIVRRDQPPTY